MGRRFTMGELQQKTGHKAYIDKDYHNDFSFYFF